MWAWRAASDKSAFGRQPTYMMDFKGMIVFSSVIAPKGDLARARIAILWSDRIRLQDSTVC